jgi:3-isopropylmalate dehydratase
MAAAAAVTGGLTDVRKMKISELPSPKDDVVGTLIAAMEAARPAPRVTPAAAAAAASAAASAGKSAATSDPSKVFDREVGKAAKLDIQNIDTDMIIPKQFLKTIKRSGLGGAAFYGVKSASWPHACLLGISISGRPLKKPSSTSPVTSQHLPVPHA